MTPSGETLTLYPPSSADDLAKVTPVYERFEAWPVFTERLKERIRREGVHALPSEPAPLPPLPVRTRRAFRSSG